MLPLWNTGAFPQNHSTTNVGLLDISIFAEICFSISPFSNPDCRRNEGKMFDVRWFVRAPFLKCCYFRVPSPSFCGVSWRKDHLHNSAGCRLVGCWKNGTKIRRDSFRRRQSFGILCWIVGIFLRLWNKLQSLKEIWLHFYAVYFVSEGKFTVACKTRYIRLSD